MIMGVNFGIYGPTIRESDNFDFWLMTVIPELRYVSRYLLRGSCRQTDTDMDIGALTLNWPG